MKQNMQDALMIAQFRRRQQLKEQYLHSEAEPSPLQAEAEKLRGLCSIAMEQESASRFGPVLAKELKFLESLRTEMENSYAAFPQGLHGTDIDLLFRDNLIMMKAAERRISAAIEFSESSFLDTARNLEEAALLLEAAGAGNNG